MTIFLGVIMASFTLTSPSFSEMELIPKEYTCSGDDISPELTWTAPPSTTKSFTLLVLDPDAPNYDNFVHWVIYNIPANERQLKSSFPLDVSLKNGTLQGMNDFGNVGYGGPCPPKPRTHRYHFTLYALDCTLPLKPKASCKEVQDAMEGHILAQSTLIGRFQQP